MGQYPSPTCDLVPNAAFDDTSAWLLAGSAVITNGNLTLSPGDQAGQSISGLTSQTTYDVTLDVSQAVSYTSLAVVLGNDTDTLSITGSGTYTTSFTTPNLGGPIAFGFENTGSGSLDIDFACLSLAATGPGGGEQTACLAPPNGDFDSASGWDFFRGATWQEPAYNVNLPQPEQGLIKTSSAFSLPTLAAGEYLLASFTATGDGGDAGIASRVNGPSAEVIFSSEVYAQPYVFEFDVTSVPDFGDTSADIAFANPGDVGLNGVFSDNGVTVDDICLFVTNRGPNLPQPLDPDAYTPVNIGSFYTCEDATAYLVNWGIDMRYHQANYQETPSIWNPEDWVPWLVSAIFVFLNVYICSFLVLIQTLINLVEYILNNGLNYGNWGVDSAEGWLTYLSSFFGNAWESNENWLNAFYTTLEDWLIWAGLAVVEFFSIPDQVVSAWLLNILTYLPALNPILAGVYAIAQAGLIDTSNASKTLTGDVLDVLIGQIWNGELTPWLETILTMLLSASPLALVNLIPEFWALLQAVFQYLWENVFQAINIPLSFYSGLSDGVQSTAFSDLMACDGSATNFWCNMFAALDLLNGIAGHSIFYPIVITGVIVGTIVILYRNALALWNFYAEWITKI